MKTTWAALIALWCGIMRISDDTLKGASNFWVVANLVDSYTYDDDGLAKGNVSLETAAWCNIEHGSILGNVNSLLGGRCGMSNISFKGSQTPDLIFDVCYSFSCVLNSVLLRGFLGWEGVPYLALWQHQITCGLNIDADIRGAGVSCVRVGVHCISPVAGYDSFSEEGLFIKDYIYQTSSVNLCTMAMGYQVKNYLPGIGVLFGVATIYGLDIEIGCFNFLVPQSFSSASYMNSIRQVYIACRFSGHTSISFDIQYGFFENVGFEVKFGVTVCGDAQQFMFAYSEEGLPIAHVMKTQPIIRRARSMVSINKKLEITGRHKKTGRFWEVFDNDGWEYATQRLQDGDVVLFMEDLLIDNTRTKIIDGNIELAGRFTAYDINNRAIIIGDYRSIVLRKSIQIKATSNIYVSGIELSSIDDDPAFVVIEDELPVNAASIDRLKERIAKVHFSDGVINMKGSLTYAEDDMDVIIDDSMNVVQDLMVSVSQDKSMAMTMMFVEGKRIGFITDRLTQEMVDLCDIIILENDIELDSPLYITKNFTITNFVYLGKFAVSTLFEDGGIEDFPIINCSKGDFLIIAKDVEIYLRNIRIKGNDGYLINVLNNVHTAYIDVSDAVFLDAAKAHVAGECMIHVSDKVGILVGGNSAIDMFNVYADLDHITVLLTNNVVARTPLNIKANREFTSLSSVGYQWSYGVSADTVQGLTNLLISRDAYPLERSMFHIEASTDLFVLQSGSTLVLKNLYISYVGARLIYVNDSVVDFNVSINNVTWADKRNISIFGEGVLTHVSLTPNKLASHTKKVCFLKQNWMLAMDADVIYLLGDVHLNVPFRFNKDVALWGGNKAAEYIFNHEFDVSWLDIKLPGNGRLIYDNDSNIYLFSGIKFSMRSVDIKNGVRPILHVISKWDRSEYVNVGDSELKCTYIDLLLTFSGVSSPNPVIIAESLVELILPDNIIITHLGSKQPSPKGYYVYGKIEIDKEISISNDVVISGMFSGIMSRGCSWTVVPPNWNSDRDKPTLLFTSLGSLKIVHPLDLHLENLIISNIESNPCVVCQDSGFYIKFTECEFENQTCVLSINKSGAVWFGKHPVYCCDKENPPILNNSGVLSDEQRILITEDVQIDKELQIYGTVIIQGALNNRAEWFLPYNNLGDRLLCVFVVPQSFPKIKFSDKASFQMALCRDLYLKYLTIEVDKENKAFIYFQDLNNTDDYMSTVFMDTSVLSIDINVVFDRPGKLVGAKDSITLYGLLSNNHPSLIYDTPYTGHLPNNFSDTLHIKSDVTFIGTGLDSSKILEFINHSGSYTARSIFIKGRAYTSTNELIQTLSVPTGKFAFVVYSGATLSLKNIAIPEGVWLVQTEIDPDRPISPITLHMEHLSLEFSTKFYVSHQNASGLLITMFLNKQYVTVGFWHSLMQYKECDFIYLLNDVNLYVPIVVRKNLLIESFTGIYEFFDYAGNACQMEFLNYSHNINSIFVFDDYAMIVDNPNVSVMCKDIVFSIKQPNFVLCKYANCLLDLSMSEFPDSEYRFICNDVTTIMGPEGRLIKTVMSSFVYDTSYELCNNWLILNTVDITAAIIVAGNVSKQFAGNSAWDRNFRAVNGREENGKLVSNALSTVFKLSDNGILLLEDLTVEHAAAAPFLIVLPTSTGVMAAITRVCVIGNAKLDLKGQYQLNIDEYTIGILSNNVTNETLYLADGGWFIYNDVDCFDISIKGDVSIGMAEKIPVWGRPDEYYVVDGLNSGRLIGMKDRPMFYIEYGSEIATLRIASLNLISNNSPLLIIQKYQQASLYIKQTPNMSVSPLILYNCKIAGSLYVIYDETPWFNVGHKSIINNGAINVLMHDISIDSAITFSSSLRIVDLGNVNANPTLYNNTFVFEGVNSTINTPYRTITLKDYSLRILNTEIYIRGVLFIVNRSDSLPILEIDAPDQDVQLTFMGVGVSYVGDSSGDRKAILILNARKLTYTNSVNTSNFDVITQNILNRNFFLDNTSMTFFILSNILIDLSKVTSIDSANVLTFIGELKLPLEIGNFSDIRIVSNLSGVTNLPTLSIGDSPGILMDENATVCFKRLIIVPQYSFGRTHIFWQNFRPDLFSIETFFGQSTVRSMKKVIFDRCVWSIELFIGTLGVEGSIEFLDDTDHQIIRLQGPASSAGISDVYQEGSHMFIWATKCLMPSSCTISRNTQMIFARYLTPAKFNIEHFNCGIYLMLEYVEYQKDVVNPSNYCTLCTANQAPVNFRFTGNAMLLLDNISFEAMLPVSKNRGVPALVNALSILVEKDRIAKIEYQCLDSPLAEMSVVLQENTWLHVVSGNEALFCIGSDVTISGLHTPPGFMAPTTRMVLRDGAAIMEATYLFASAESYTWIHRFSAGSLLLDIRLEGVFRPRLLLNMEGWRTTARSAFSGGDIKYWTLLNFVNADIEKVYAMSGYVLADSFFIFHENNVQAKDKWLLNLHDCRIYTSLNIQTNAELVITVTKDGKKQIIQKNYKGYSGGDIRHNVISYDNVIVLADIESPKEEFSFGATDTLLGAPLRITSNLLDPMGQRPSNLIIRFINTDPISGVSYNHQMGLSRVCINTSVTQTIKGLVYVETSMHHTLYYDYPSIELTISPEVDKPTCFNFVDTSTGCADIFVYNSVIPSLMLEESIENINIFVLGEGACNRFIKARKLNITFVMGVNKDASANITKSTGTVIKIYTDRLDPNSNSAPIFTFYNYKEALFNSQAITLNCVFVQNINMPPAKIVVMESGLNDITPVYASNVNLVSWYNRAITSYSRDSYLRIQNAIDFITADNTVYLWLLGELFIRDGVAVALPFSVYGDTNRASWQDLASSYGVKVAYVLFQEFVGRRNLRRDLRPYVGWEWRFLPRVARINTSVGCIKIRAYSEDLPEPVYDERSTVIGFFVDDTDDTSKEHRLTSYIYIDASFLKYSRMEWLRFIGDPNDRILHNIYFMINPEEDQQQCDMFREFDLHIMCSKELSARIWFPSGKNIAHILGNKDLLGKINSSVKTSNCNILLYTFDAAQTVLTFIIRADSTAGILRPLYVGTHLVVNDVYAPNRSINFHLHAEENVNPSWFGNSITIGGLRWLGLYDRFTVVPAKKTSSDYGSFVYIDLPAGTIIQPIQIGGTAVCEAGKGLKLIESRKPVHIRLIDLRYLKSTTDKGVTVTTPVLFENVGSAEVILPSNKKMLLLYGDTFGNQLQKKLQFDRDVWFVLINGRVIWDATCVVTHDLYVSSEFLIRKEDGPPYPFKWLAPTLDTNTDYNNVGDADLVVNCAWTTEFANEDKRIAVINRFPFRMFLIYKSGVIVKLHKVCLDFGEYDPPLSGTNPYRKYAKTEPIIAAAGFIPDVKAAFTSNTRRLSRSDIANINIFPTTSFIDNVVFIMDQVRTPSIVAPDKLLRHWKFFFFPQTIGMAVVFRNIDITTVETDKFDAVTVPMILDDVFMLKHEFSKTSLKWRSKINIAPIASTLNTKKDSPNFLIMETSSVRTRCLWCYGVDLRIVDLRKMVGENTSIIDDSSRNDLITPIWTRISNSFGQVLSKGTSLIVFNGRNEAGVNKSYNSRFLTHMPSFLPSSLWDGLRADPGRYDIHPDARHIISSFPKALIAGSLAVMERSYIDYETINWSRLALIVESWGVRRVQGWQSVSGNTFLSLFFFKEDLALGNNLPIPTTTIGIYPPLTEVWVNKKQPRSYGWLAPLTTWTLSEQMTNTVENYPNSVNLEESPPVIQSEGNTMCLVMFLLSTTYFDHWMKAEPEHGVANYLSRHVRLWNPA